MHVLKLRHPEFFDIANFAILLLQPGAAELGGRHPVVAHGLRGAVPLPRGAAAQEDDRDGRELEVSGPEISKLQGSLAHEL